MNLKLTHILRLLACLITIGLIFGHKVLPEKRKLINPLSSNEPVLYADGDWGGLSVVNWVGARRDTRWLCRIRESEQQPVCGMSISFMGEGGNPINFSGYDRLELKIEYNGDSDKLRLYLRNHNSAYSSMEDPESFKFNSVFLPAHELALEYTIIPLDEMKVADWWIEQKNIERKHSHVEYNNVVALGFDVPPPNVYGEHLIHVSSIEIVGEWISAEMLYLVIIIAWMTAIISEALVRLIGFYRRTSIDRYKIRHLTDYANALQEQTDIYRELSSVDALTGVFNRNGIAKIIDSSFAEGAKIQDLAIILIDIDHFKRVNDRRGHDVGDLVLKGFADIISKNIRPKDTFARWGGEEFIIISPDTDLQAAVRFGEKLRECVASNTFGSDEIRGLTASFGVTVARDGDSFEDAFKRADIALYRAKEFKRNCVVVEE